MTGAIISGKEFTDRIREIVLKNLTNEKFGVSDLASKMEISRSGLHRKIRKFEECSVSRFICQVRLKKANELLQSTSLAVSEIACECGFHSVTYFDKCFHDYYGFTPAHARNGKRTSSQTKNRKKTGIHQNNPILIKGRKTIHSFFQAISKYRNKI